MPRYKDRPDIPGPLLKALVSDKYEDSLDSHFENLPKEVAGKFQHAISVTTLARSPRQRILWNRHHQEIEIDPEDRFWAILGRTVHSILEQNHEPHQVVEERIGTVVPLKTGSRSRIDVYLHGQADVYDTKAQRIEDWKFNKAEGQLYSKEDHEAQLNVLGHIWIERGKPVKALRNTYLFRNWEARNVKEGTLYPKGRILVKDVPLWPKERTVEYLQKRLMAHVMAEGLPDDELPACTDAERWVSPPLYKVYKVDEASGEPQKVAKHTATSMTEAEDKITELLDEDWEKAVAKNNERAKPKPESELKKTSYIVKEIRGRPVRCLYCEVAAFCNIRRAEILAEGDAIPSTEEDSGAPF